jgi:hypothetical protein
MGVPVEGAASAGTEKTPIDVPGPCVVKGGTALLGGPELEGTPGADRNEAGPVVGVPQVP